jgi:hypothetical protein
METMFTSEIMRLGRPIQTVMIVAAAAALSMPCTVSAGQPITAMEYVPIPRFDFSGNKTRSRPVRGNYAKQRREAKRRRRQRRH